MTLEPLLSAPLVIQVHAVSAIAAFVIGTIQFIAPKGTIPHRAFGVLWMALMASAAASASFILHGEPGDPIWTRLSPIHLFVPLTVWALIQGGYMLARGKRPGKGHHSQPFFGAYVGGLIIAGVLAFALPGRIMNQVLFGGG
jgi:uncharacterized membrane protein